LGLDRRIYRDNAVFNNAFDGRRGPGVTPQGNESDQKKIPVDSQGVLDARERVPMPGNSIPTVRDRVPGAAEAVPIDGN
jgi:hypothetical protein